jgi:hypothetical protein
MEILKRPVHLVRIRAGTDRLGHSGTAIRPTHTRRALSRYGVLT